MATIENQSTPTTAPSINDSIAQPQSTAPLAIAALVPIAEQPTMPVASAAFVPAPTVAVELSALVTAPTVTRNHARVAATRLPLSMPMADSRALADAKPSSVVQSATTQSSNVDVTSPTVIEDKVVRKLVAGRAAAQRVFVDGAFDDGMDELIDLLANTCGARAGK
jgi:hypothetical protein